MMQRALIFALQFGALSSTLLALTVTLWEWLENPGGIFRGSEGTHWSFVAETAVSWLVPGFCYLALVGLVGHLLLSGLRHWKARWSVPAANQQHEDRVDPE